MREKGCSCNAREQNDLTKEWHNSCHRPEKEQIMNVECAVECTQNRDEMRREQLEKRQSIIRECYQDEMRRAQDRELEERSAQNVQDETKGHMPEKQRQRGAQDESSRMQVRQMQEHQQRIHNWRHNGFKMKSDVLKTERQLLKDKRMNVCHNRLNGFKTARGSG